jgi:nucleoside-diphosphate-sugar epimerase
MAQPHHYDISKIQRELGYAPRVRLEEGLKQAVEWYLGLK